MSQASNDNTRIDRAVVTGTVYGKTMTLLPTLHRDRADGSTSTIRWGPATSGDGANYQTIGNWSSSFSTSRYLAFTFPAYVPGAAVITSASITNTYKSATSGDTTCWYAAIYSGVTLIGTHGSSGSPISCNSTNSFTTNTLTLSEVDTAAEANSLSLVIFARNTGSRRSQHDLIHLTVNYSLAATGCTDPGTVTVTATADSWVDEASPTSTAGATDVDLRVRSRSTNEDRRTLVWFPLPTVPDGCSVTSATLRLYQNTSAGTRTIQAWRLASSWTESGVNWNNQPAMAGTAATSTNGSGWRTWTVTTMVEELYSIANHGFLLKDSSEESGTGYEQRYDSREDVNDPELLITFG
jgi:hypothetical protein